MEGSLLWFASSTYSCYSRAGLMEEEEANMVSAFYGPSFPHPCPLTTRCHFLLHCHSQGGKMCLPSCCMTKWRTSIRPRPPPKKKRDRKMVKENLVCPPKPPKQQQQTPPSQIPIQNSEAQNTKLHVVLTLRGGDV